MSQAATGGRKANERVRQLVDAFEDERRGRHDWTFFCECGDPFCEEMVHLSPRMYDSITGENEGRVLAEGHPTAARGR